MDYLTEDDLLALRAGEPGVKVWADPFNGAVMAYDKVSLTILRIGMDMAALMCSAAGFGRRRYRGHLWISEHGLVSTGGVSPMTHAQILEVENRARWRIRTLARARLDTNRLAMLAAVQKAAGAGTFMDMQIGPCAEGPHLFRAGDWEVYIMGDDGE